MAIFNLLKLLFGVLEADSSRVPFPGSQVTRSLPLSACFPASFFPALLNLLSTCKTVTLNQGKGTEES